MSPTATLPHVERADARDEIAGHRGCVLRFVDRAWPHLSALERMAAELGPVALRHALTLETLLAGLERQHLPQTDADELLGEPA